MKRGHHKRGFLTVACLVAVVVSGLPLLSSNAFATNSPSGLVAAQKVVDQYTKQPKTLGDEGPLKSKPPKGKTLVWITCDNPNCVLISDELAQAAKVVGWNFRSIPFTLADPASLISGMQTALQFSPVAVGEAGIPVALWQSEIPIYKAAHIAIIPNSSGPVPFSSTVPAEIDGPSDSARQGAVLADWFIANSHGKGHVVLADVPDIGSLSEAGTAFRATVAKGCPQCKVTTLNVPVPDLANGAVVPLEVSAVQKDPSIKYVVVEEGASSEGLPAALSAAGLSGIKIGGTNASGVEFADIAQGTVAAFDNTPYRVLAWKILDVALRVSEGMRVETNDGGLPLELLDKTNIGHPSPSLRSIERPSDYQKLFLKLWKIH